MSKDMQSAMSTEANEKMKGSDEHNDPALDESKRLMEAEFNADQAKMKELFLQKEEEMRKIRLDKKRLLLEMRGLRAQLQELLIFSENQREDIQSLQRFVNDTVEGSIYGTEEVRRLRARCVELEQHLNQIKQCQEQQFQ